MRGIPCDHHPWYIGPHCTGTSLATALPPPDIKPHCTNLLALDPLLFKWDFNVLGPTDLCPPDMGPHCTGTPASDIWYPRLVTCSNFSWGPPTTADIRWLLKYVWLAREQFASYCNVFLLLFERLLLGAKFSVFNLWSYPYLTASFFRMWKEYQL